MRFLYECDRPAGREPFLRHVTDRCKIRNKSKLHTAVTVVLWCPLVRLASVRRQRAAQRHSQHVHSGNVSRDQSVDSRKDTLRNWSYCPRCHMNTVAGDMLSFPWTESKGDSESTRLRRDTQMCDAMHPGTGLNVLAWSNMGQQGNSACGAGRFSEASWFRTLAHYAATAHSCPCNRSR